MSYQTNWRNTKLPDSIRNFRGMLTEDERTLLYDIALNYFEGYGCIADLGPFLGVSTYCFGLGIKDKGYTRPMIHAYDTFILPPGQHYRPYVSPGYQEGQDLVETFKENVKDVLPLVKIYQGDILTQSLPDERIEVLFIDLAKNPLVNDYVVERYFAQLIPGRSLVIQQDFLWKDWNAWIHCTMEYLSEYFEIVDCTPTNSVVFLNTKEIPLEKLKRVFRGRTKEEVIALHKEHIRKFDSIYLKYNQNYHTAILNQSHEHLLSKIDSWIKPPAPTPTV